MTPIVDFRCCKTAEKTQGRTHDIKCTGRAPSLRRKKTVRINPETGRTELIEDPLYEGIRDEDLMGCEVVQSKLPIQSHLEGIQMADSKMFIIKLESQFIPTPTMVKQKLGIGFKVLSVEVERESYKEIKDVDSAVDAILYTGYRALARANHPDLGGNAETMVILNRAKKELMDLLKELKA